MELVRWQPRTCKGCPPGQGCNENLPWIETTPAIKDIITGYLEREGPIPQGTHIQLIDVLAAGKLNLYKNPATGLPFRNFDVVEALTAASQQDGIYATVRSDKETPTIRGSILRDWIPTHLAVSRGGADAEQSFWAAQYVEATAMMLKELQIRKFNEEEATAFANFMEVLRAGVKKGDLGPPADFTAGESFMKAGTGWRFLKAAGACENPVRYIRGFPEDMPVAEVWHDYLRNGKDNPMGQRIEWYWVTTIINYSPGLLRECTERTRNWLEKNVPEYARRGGDHHFQNEQYRHAFFDLNPWELIEFRLRQTGDQDRGKKNYTDENGMSRFIYTPNDHDIKTGIYRRPVEEKPQEQQAAAAKAA